MYECACNWNTLVLLVGLPFVPFCAYIHKLYLKPEASIFTCTFLYSIDMTCKN